MGELLLSAPGRTPRSDREAPVRRGETAGTVCATARRRGGTAITLRQPGGQGKRPFGARRRVGSTELFGRFTFLRRRIHRQDCDDGRADDDKGPDHGQEVSPIAAGAAWPTCYAVRRK